MASYTLRPATEADFALMRAIKFDGLRPYVEAAYGWDDEQQQRYFAERFDPACTRIVVVGGEDAGYVHVLEDAEAVILSGIFLSAAARGRGVGSALIADLIEDAARRGKGVALRVLKTNLARALYERLGFTVTGETELHYVMRRGASRQD